MCIINIITKQQEQPTTVSMDHPQTPVQQPRQLDVPPAPVAVRGGNFGGGGAVPQRIDFSQVADYRK